MRRTHHASPLPPDAKGREDIIRPPANGAVPASREGDGYQTAASYRQARQTAGLRHGALRAATVIAALTGLWVAISPWFLTLQVPRGGNATANNLIVGLVVAALGILALERLRARSGLTAASLLAGIWVLISPFILAAKFPITASMYWSNIWAGAVIIGAGLGALAAAASRPGASHGMT